MRCDQLVDRSSVWISSSPHTPYTHSSLTLSPYCLGVESLPWVLFPMKSINVSEEDRTVFGITRRSLGHMLPTHTHTYTHTGCYTIYTIYSDLRMFPCVSLSVAPMSVRLSICPASVYAVRNIVCR